jgi:pantothenate kinase|tara:strand:- start:51 stop:689 length:639 start_codon:yes stop_codon:yes gene_type:complete
MEIYNQIVDELYEKSKSMVNGTQFWIGLAGAPGSGKSTLANLLKIRLKELLVVIPLDGYHYYRSELDQMKKSSQAYTYRGAPFTFNSQKFFDDLTTARKSRSGIFPSFDHGIKDPIEKAIHLSTDHKIILVEGNYLLLNSDPWCSIRKLFDETWLLDIPIEVSNARVAKRHVATGLTEYQALKRVRQNDDINAKLIAKESFGNADKIIKYCA